MKVVMYMTQSLNGFVANGNGETPWSQESWEVFNYTVRNCNNFIIGRKTYELMKQGGEIEFVRNPLIVVVTSQIITNDPHVVSVDSPKAAVELVKSQGYETALLAGGSKLNTSFLNENLVDEIYIDVEPIIFKNGVPLIKDLTWGKLKLKFLGAENYRHVVARLRYQVVKNKKQVDQSY